MCADIPGFGGGSENGPVNQAPCNPDRAADNQVWQFDSGASTTAFTIRNPNTGRCMDLPGFESIPAGTAVSEYPCRPGSVDNQMFERSAAGGGYFFSHVKTGLCLDVAGPAGTGGVDARLTLAPCDPRDDHRWRTE